MAVSNSLRVLTLLYLAVDAEVKNLMELLVLGNVITIVNVCLVFFAAISN